MRTSAPVDSPYALPEIELNDGNLLGILEQAEEAILAASDQRLFQRGGKVVHLQRIECKETTRGITRQAGSLIIEPATPECIALEMARTARYLKWKKTDKKYVATDPPKKYAQFMAAQDELPFKVLLGTMETPTLRPDGSILQKHGYDEDSGVYFDSPLDFPQIS
jgi:putative DNA primase/helicase